VHWQGGWGHGRAPTAGGRGAQVNERIGDLRALMRFLDSVACHAATHNLERTEGSDRKIITATFVDRGWLRWRGNPPEVAITFDATHRWVLHAKFAWRGWSKRLSTKDVLAVVLEMLRDARVIAKPPK